MLTKTSLIVFIIFVGQLGYIVMSDSEKIEIFIFWKKKKIYAFFWSRKVKKCIKYTFCTDRYLQEIGFWIEDHLLRWNQLSDLCHSFGWLKVPWLLYYKENCPNNNGQ